MLSYKILRCRLPAKGCRPAVSRWPVAPLLIVPSQSVGSKCTENGRMSTMRRRLFTLVSIFAATVAGAQQTAPPPDCSAAEHRQFDFWIGSWDVFNAQGKQTGKSEVTSALKGCTLHERWETTGGFVGESNSRRLSAATSSSAAVRHTFSLVVGMAADSLSRRTNSRPPIVLLCQNPREYQRRVIFSKSQQAKR
jgi:hypothetical protein